MRGLRCDRIMVGTALALVLAGPLAAMAQEAEQAPKVAAGLVEASASPQAQSPAPNELPANARTPSPAENSRPGNVEGDSERGSNHDLFASLDPADRAIAEKIRELLAGDSGSIFSGSEERLKVEAFYQKRQFAPLWLDKGSENARKASVANRLEHADVDGLEVADYRIPTFTGSAPDALAEAELKLTQSILTYARHLQAGRFFRHQVKYEIGLPQAAPDPEEVLAKLAEAPDPGAALDAFSPQNEPYRRLKVMLAELRESRTVRKLNGPGPDRTIETIIANMERWRWYPRDLGEAHVLVNLPDFTLKVMHKGAQIWASRIVVGEPSKPSPLLSERMTSITLNPVWHVPPSIVQNEYLPALARDRNVLARMGLHLSYNGGEPQITMPAGGINPLGHIRFNFYNRFMVFQHDTPDQYMFAHAVRAESHGCMRVEHAAKYAELLFSLARPDEHWTAARVKTMFGSAEQEIPLEPAPVWLHLTYQTAFVDDDGKLQIRRDLYNLDRRTLAALKNDPVTAEPAPAANHDHELASASRHRRNARHSQGGDVVQSPFFAGPSNVRPRSGVRVLYR